MRRLTVRHKICIYYFLIISCFSILLCSLYEPPAVAEYKDNNIKTTVASQDIMPFEVSAQSAVLIDANSGDVLYSKNSSAKLAMASTTKIMTAIVAIENFDLEDMVTVTKKSVGIEGSSVYLTENEKIKMIDLLYGLLLESGNDAADAIAVAVAGSTEEFVKMMNDKASSLNLSYTHFDNPHGLTSETHYTTALELSKIAAYAMKNKTFREIVSTKTKLVHSDFLNTDRLFVNHNKLLKYSNLCNGIKTGYTKAAGRCLVSSFGKDNSLFIAVTLNDRNDWQDHEKMQNYAIDNFKTLLVAKKNSLRSCLGENGKTVYNAEDIYITVPKTYPEEISVSLEINKENISESTALVEYSGKHRSYSLSET